ncbi:MULTISPECIES: hypothetical protein [Shewanella]|uniref:hypothetical protein n=1 Tax=Shewanella TaxID=22 RepID=UPI001C65E92B|nr:MULTISPECIES: hypothetical protein [Shewanella]QYJ76409.1 hypothetical protein K0H79_05410 [Shewanella sp. FJAT-52076]QYK06325.1 hypothetical protein K0H63_05755 [Shewanella zhangzhouensis]
MRALLILSLSAGLTACASNVEDVNQCGWVSGYQDPPEAERLYRAVVTDVNGTPVISRPNYQLAPGRYEFSLVELIDAPDLKVTPDAHQRKTLTIEVAAGMRYHFAARYKDDRRYFGNNPDFWEPVIWQSEAAECTFAN